jgi:5,6-dimethylbenzimidazole synthase
MTEEFKTRIKALQCRDEYLSDPIALETLTEILEHVKYTPSMANMQPWEIVVVTNPETRMQLKNALLDPMLREDDELRQDWLLDAPVILVVCMDMRRAKVRFGERGIEFALLDIGAAISNLMLGAWGQGLKGCDVREFDQDKLRKLLEIPKDVLPLSLIALGYSNQDKAVPPTLELDDFVHNEKWDGEW